MTNPYAALGVPNGADKDTCKKAYRRLAKQFHPDLNPGNAEAEARFKEINEAWESIESGRLVIEAPKRDVLVHDSLFTFVTIP